MSNKPNFEFEIAGINRDNNLMVLVDDKLYGKCCYIIEDVDKDNKIQFSLIKTFVENVPQYRQDKILTAILAKIVEESRE